MGKEMFLVVGLGTFGAQTAAALAAGGADVLAVDRAEEAVQAIAHKIERAVCLDATDLSAMEKVGAFDATTAVVALRRHFDAAVLVTHGLRRAGVGEILVQIDSGQESEAILAVGASRTVFPERDMADRIGQNLLSPNLLDLVPLGDGVGLIEVVCPEPWAGKTLIDLGLRKNYGVTVVALKPLHRSGELGSVEAAPSPEEPIQMGDRLVVIGKSRDLERFREAATQASQG